MRKAKETSRRKVLKGIAASGAGVAVLARGPAQAADAPPTFTELERALDKDLTVADGHTAQVLLRFGDPIKAGAPAWTPENQSKENQERQFGSDNDFLAYMPLPHGSSSSSHGLLCANHESSRAGLIFDLAGKTVDDMTAAQMDIDMAAHGFAVVEIRREGETWKPVLESKFNRRFTSETPFAVSGPAAGHARLRTSDDPSGARVLGTLGNCAGGVTPWGTVLSGEENVHHFFLGKPAGAEKESQEAMGLGAERFYGWGKFHKRFDTTREPNEFNRFGWVVEIDPYDPASTPVKRTALGRFRHEGASVVQNRDGRLVVYMGDDQAFEHVYKFVSRDPVRADPAANRSLLDHGTLYAARFDDGGRLVWLPLVHGEGPLTAANGFSSQADVVIDARRAAKLLGATPMDRAEDIEIHPSGNVYVALTKNARREKVDAANPRARNRHGMVAEITPAGGAGASADHAAPEATWRPLLLGGDPNDMTSGARYHPAVSKNGWLSCPDNFVTDVSGRLWITTDGANDFGASDGIYVTEVSGPDRALTRLFLRVPIGGEATGPCFTPDGTTLFVSIQHPGADSGSTFRAPSTRWPDFKEGVPPRPSVVAIRRRDGKPVG